MFVKDPTDVHLSSEQLLFTFESTFTQVLRNIYEDLQQYLFTSAAMFIKVPTDVCLGWLAIVVYIRGDVYFRCWAIFIQVSGNNWSHSVRCISRFRAVCI